MAEVERTYATGRRKCAVARVCIWPGNGKVTVNGRGFEEYFPRETSRMIIQQPFEITERVERYDMMVNVGGGGLSGQAGAVKHGLSRALDPELNTLHRSPRLH